MLSNTYVCVNIRDVFNIIPIVVVCYVLYLFGTWSFASCNLILFLRFKMKFLLLALVLTAVQANDKLIDDFIAANARFTAKIYKELLKSNSGSFMTCPLSVEIILGLMHSGAKGNTAKELSAAFEFPDTKEKTEETFSKLLPSLRGKEDYTLSSANKVYVKNDFKINDQFKNVAIKMFESDLQTINFNNSPAAVAEINKWVEDKTQSKIKNLLAPKQVDENTVAVLVNAMFFQGTWLQSFNQNLTKKKQFFLNDKKQVDIDMMELTAYFDYYESSELKAKFLEIPYKGDDISMVVVLPNDKAGLSSVEGRINEVFTAPKFTTEKVNVEIPKYKIETSIAFVPILQALGINDAFVPNADFSGITNQPIYISTVIQKTFVEVNENGTSAAAGTAVTMNTGSAPGPSKPPKEFIADHPFICYIKSKAGVMFIGRFTGN